MFIIIIIASWFYGLFAFSQIFIPLFRGIPRAIKKKKSGNILQMLITIIIWSVISFFLYSYVTEKYIKYHKPINIGLCISAIMILLKTFVGGADLESDMNDSYGL